jgi:hypothetical protein
VSSGYRDDLIDTEGAGASLWRYFMFLGANTYCNTVLTAPPFEQHGLRIKRSASVWTGGLLLKFTVIVA